jgi:protein-S-isoprenylcysteine O-methyltransferase Ste14
MFPEVIVFWSVFLWAFLPEMRLILRATKSLPGKQDAGTVRLIAAVNQAAMFIAFMASFLTLSATGHPRVALYAGTSLLLVGSILRRYCFRTLGQHFTGEVTVSAQQPVIDRGPYRWIRHPSYTGGMLMFLGIGIALANWVSLVIMVLGPYYAYSRRVPVEERALLETIGEPYRAYMARTKRFVPFLW